MSEAKRPGGLSSKQVEEFVENGYVILKGCFSKTAAGEWIEAAYTRLGYDRNDPGTWKEKKAFLPGNQGVLVREFAPKAWAGICRLVGGRERIDQADKHSWSDSFVVKFPLDKAGAWRAPGKEKGGWHKDGPHSPHFLDSPEMGLLTYVLWSELRPRGGGTFLAPESVGHVARHLARHPEGADKEKDLPIDEIIKSCRRFVELTGEPGDVILAHPYMLHAESDNACGPPRFFTVRIVELARPMDFSGETREISPVERAVLRGLGKKRFRFNRKK